MLQKDCSQWTQTADIVYLQELCDLHDATLLVDIAHDFGSLRPGEPAPSASKMLGNVDLVMGSFSKTFTSNGGFLATDSRAVKEYVSLQCIAYLLERLSPLQANVVKTTLEIVRSAEGDQLRQLLDAIHHPRTSLATRDRLFWQSVAHRP
ncbi:MAG: aminotransferase class I/II-fold pyridoxal phosphate-dependent enzyme [Caldilineaceae bacterium]